MGVRLALLGIVFMSSYMYLVLWNIMVTGSCEMWMGFRNGIDVLIWLVSIAITLKARCE